MKSTHARNIRFEVKDARDRYWVVSTQEVLQRAGSSKLEDRAFIRAFNQFGKVLK